MAAAILQHSNIYQAENLSDRCRNRSLTWSCAVCKTLLAFFAVNHLCKKCQTNCQCVSQKICYLLFVVVAFSSAFKVSVQFFKRLCQSFQPTSYWINTNWIYIAKYQNINQFLCHYLMYCSCLPVTFMYISFCRQGIFLAALVCQQPFQNISFCRQGIFRKTILTIQTWKK